LWETLIFFMILPGIVMQAIEANYPGRLRQEKCREQKERQAEIAAWIEQHQAISTLRAHLIVPSALAGAASGFLVSIAAPPHGAILTQLSTNPASILSPARA
jgi:hypothetical protein